MSTRLPYRSIWSVWRAKTWPSVGLRPLLAELVVPHRLLVADPPGEVGGERLEQQLRSSPNTGRVLGEGQSGSGPARGWRRDERVSPQHEAVGKVLEGLELYEGARGLRRDRREARPGPGRAVTRPRTGFMLAMLLCSMLLYALRSRAS